MRKIPLSIVVTICLLLSCSKKKNVDNPTTPATDTPMKYKVGINYTELNLLQCLDTTIYVPISFQHISGIYEPITVQVDNSPSWIMADTFAVIPDYTGYLLLIIHPTQAGKFPISISTMTKSSPKQSLILNVNVKAMPECPTLFLCNYSEKTECSRGKHSIGVIDPHIRVLPEDNANHIKIEFSGANFGMYAYEGIVDCLNQTIYVPGDSLGHFNEDSITIYLDVHEDNVGLYSEKIYDHCKSVLTRTH